MSASDIPLLPDIGLLGHTRMLRNDPIAFLRRLSEAGGLFRMRLLDKLVVVVTDPELVQEALVERAASLEKSSLTRYLLYPLAGEGLFTSRGELWRRQRRLMAPIFPPGKIAHFAESMVACAQRGADTWRDGETVDVARQTARIAMSIAGKTLFDADTFSPSPRRTRSAPP
jgi:cytochrome P450